MFRQMEGLFDIPSWSKLLFCLLLISIGSLGANPMRPDNMQPQVAPMKSTQVPTIRVAPKPILQDIVIVGQYKAAVFRGNKTVELGELINQYRLIDVTPSYVVIAKGQQKQQLYLPEFQQVQIRPASEE